MRIIKIPMRCINAPSVKYESLYHKFLESAIKKLFKFPHSPGDINTNKRTHIIVIPANSTYCVRNKNASTIIINSFMYIRNHSLFEGNLL